MGIGEIARRHVPVAGVREPGALHRPGLPLQCDLLHALVLTEVYGASAVGRYLIPFAVGNFLGPFLLGRVFDTIGRKPMIAGTYVLSRASALSRDVQRRPRVREHPRLLSDAGRPREAERWRVCAASRYEELVSRHPEALLQRWRVMCGDAR
jgi:hypothetical protein